MLRKEKGLLGHFKKFGTKFTTYDDGRTIQVQIVSKSSKYNYQKLKKYYLKQKLLTIQSTNGICFYDYHVVDFWYRDENSFDIYYDYCIERYKDRKCYSIEVTSDDINVFGQNRSFLNNIYAGVKNDNFCISSENYTCDFDIDNKKYKLELINTLLSPAFQKNSIAFTTILKMTSYQEMDFFEINKLLELIMKMIRFCTYRKNIIFSSVELFDKYDETINLDSPFGILYLNVEEKAHEFKSFNDNGMIKIDAIKDCIPQLLKYISNDFIDTVYIPNDTDSFNSVFVNSTAWIQSLFRKWASSNNRFKVIKIDVLDTILKNSQGNNKKVIFLEMIDHLIDYSNIFKTDAFDKKMGFFRFFNNLEEYKNKLSERIKNIRNDFCHGHIDFSKAYYKFLNKDLEILNMIIYCTILKYIGVSEEKRDKALNQLFNKLDLTI